MFGPGLLAQCASSRQRAEDFAARNLTRYMFAGDAVDAAARTPPGHEGLELLADKIRGRRLMTQIEIYDKARKRLAELGVDGWVVPDKTVVPLLEFAGLEDDEDMRSWWTNLLVSAAEDAASVLPSFPHILRDLSPREAQALDGGRAHEPRTS